MRKALLAFVLVYIVSYSVSAQDGFEGMIEFKFEYQDVPERLSSHIGKLSPGMTVFAKGQKCRKQQSGPSSGSQVVVDDYANAERFILMDIFGRRIALTQASQTVAKEGESKKQPTYEYTRESREIAGFKCKKVWMTRPGETEKSALWVSDAFECSDPKFSGLQGFPLEFSMVRNDIRIVATATHVEQMLLGDPLFDIPLGYDEMDAQEFETFLATLDP